MDPKTLKLLGIICLVIFVVSLFVAYERYQTNAKNVRAMNRGPISLPGGSKLETNFEVFKPATPTATKYALFFAALSVGGAVACFIGSRPKYGVETGTG